MLAPRYRDGTLGFVTSFAESAPLRTTEMERWLVFAWAVGATVAKAASAANAMVSCRQRRPLGVERIELDIVGSMGCSLLVVVGVEHAYLGDLVERELVPGRGPSDCFGVGCVVDAERRVLVVADVRVDPGDAVLGVPLDHRKTDVRSAVSDGNQQAVREGALNHVSGHLMAPEVGENACLDSRSAASCAHREGCLDWRPAATYLGRGKHRNRARPGRARWARIDQPA